MYRAAILALAMLVFPSVVAAQQPCTTDARHVVNELYRHMLEREADPGSAHWVQQLENGRMTVRDVVLAVATSPEYTQRFVYTETGESTPYERSVARLYRHILGRQPDPEGQRAFARLAQQSGPQVVIERIVSSMEYNRQFGAWGVPGSGGLRYCPTDGSASSQIGSGASSQIGSGVGSRFRDMDRNADGLISRAEWRSASRSMPAFNQLDANNDSRLTRNEFRGRPIGDEFETEPTTGQSVLVDSRERWTDTGTRVRAGDLILFDVAGTIRMSGDSGDVATARGARSGRHAADSPLSNQLAGALIGRIDGGAPFLIANRRSVRAPSTGRLYVGVNDDYLEDNSGEFEVMIYIST